LSRHSLLETAEDECEATEAEEGCGGWPGNGILAISRVENPPPALMIVIDCVVVSAVKLPME